MTYIKLRLSDFQQLISAVSNLNAVLWLRTPDYQQQLYVSPSYETVWQRPCRQLYEAPNEWGDALIGKKSDQLKLLFAPQSQQAQVESKMALTTVLYRIALPKQRVGFIQDTHFYLLNTFNEPVAIAGIAHSISHDQWQQQADNACSRLSEAQNADQQQWINVLKLMGLTVVDRSAVFSNSNADDCLYQYVVMNNGNRIKLTPREMTCLLKTQQGLQAKQIAYTLSISVRTVEVYLNRIKEKTGCRTLTALMAKLKGFDT